jgi:histidinol-phosphate/aromatic aminotransferase/cobyric acid decarboxylase-like protein/CTP:phosphocholine cytidylyltransferase-like protein
VWQAVGEARGPRLLTSSVRRAIILAAGSGQRLRPLTDEVPKCLVPVDGEPILHRTLRALAEQGLQEAVVVIGHQAERVVKSVGDRFCGLEIEYVRANQYRTTNNVYSLWEARGYCDEDVLLIEGDVVAEPEVIRRLLEVSGNAMAVAPYRNCHSGTVVRQSEDARVISMVLGSEQGPDFDYTDAYKTVNIYRFGGRFIRERYVPAIGAQIAAGNVGIYYESVLADLIRDGQADFVAVDVGDRLWYEIDDHSDLDAAEYLFAPPLERLERVQELHGGYWRYDFTDHCYLYNLYFPPEEMLAQFSRDMRDIITSYPVGQGELARLVSNWTGIEPGSIAVANGASELIKILGRGYASSISIPVPSFNEYESVIDSSLVQRFLLDEATFDLDVEEFAAATIRAGARAAVVVTPNNPTSLSVPRPALLYLAERLRRHGCRLIVDESFIEFSAAGPAETLEKDLDDHPNVILIKSMSKVFGIAGLRLGYLASADRRVVGDVRRELPIWNINGLGEAFLRSLCRFRREFFESCERVKADRDQLYRDLLTVPGLQPFRPDANFVFCRIEEPGLTGPDLVRGLFVGHNILIKDCAGKSMREGERYVRIASRRPEENARLVEALRRLD